MKLETDRLEIDFLSSEQLALWINDLPCVEKNLNCIYQAEPMSGIFKQIVQQQLEITRKDPENYIWHSFCFIIRKLDRIVVGTADFKDVPDENGDVEIGYGLGKPFENQGYMAETVRAMCAWALKQEGVKNVVAETELNGIRSQHVLQKCGFTEYAKDETVWWKLQR